MIKTGLKKVSNMKVNFESLKQARINALLSRGDRKVSAVIQTASEQGWSKAFKRYQPYCDYVISTHHSLETQLPWDFLDATVSKRFLAREYARAQTLKTTPACPMIQCSSCRICI
jgi:hypothetical protein